MLGEFAPANPNFKTEQCDIDLVLNIGHPLLGIRPSIDIVLAIVHKWYHFSGGGGKKW